MDACFSYPSVLNILEVSNLDIPVKQTPPQRHRGFAFISAPVWSLMDTSSLSSSQWVNEVGVLEPSRLYPTPTCLTGHFAAIPQYVSYYAFLSVKVCLRLFSSLQLFFLFHRCQIQLVVWCFSHVFPSLFYHLQVFATIWSSIWPQPWEWSRIILHAQILLWESR